MVFNPLIATGDSDRKINAILFQGLLRYRADLTLETNLASSFVVLDDRPTLVFSLHEDARWHDGRPVTAHDVVFTLETVLNPDYHGPYRDRFLYIKGAKDYLDGKADHVSGLKVKDDRVVLVELEKPHGPALGEVGTLPLIPRHLIVGIPVDRLSQAGVTGELAVGSGPFRLESFRRVGGSGDDGVGQAAGVITEVILSRVPEYFRGEPRVERITFRVLKDASDLAGMREEGVDILQINPRDAGSLAGDYVVREWPVPGYYYLGLNLGRNPLDDKGFRRAVAHAVDGEAIARALFDGRATMMYAPVFPGSWAEAPGLDPYLYDSKESRRLVAELGWEDVEDSGVVEKGSRRLVLNFLYEKGNPTAEEIASMVSDYLAAVGIGTRLQGLEYQELLRRVFRQRDFDLYLLTWELTPDPDVYDLFTPNVPANAVGFDLPRARELLQQGRETMPIELRRPIYEEWTRLANRELPYIFLFAPNNVIAVSSRLRGLWVSPLGYWHQTEAWWVDQ